MRNYNEFLSELEKLRNEPASPKRNLMISLLRSRLNTLALSIKYQKIKLLYGIKIDYFETDNLLNSFFGKIESKSLDKKLKELRKKLREVSRIDPKRVKP